MNKEEQNKLFIQIMEADEKDGLYKTNNMAQQTAVDYLIEQLQAPCRGIPSHIIQQAKQMEKEQIMKANILGMQYVHCDENQWEQYAEQYYNETYNK